MPYQKIILHEATLFFSKIQNMIDKNWTVIKEITINNTIVITLRHKINEQQQIIFIDVDTREAMPGHPAAGIYQYYTAYIYR